MEFLTKDTAFSQLEPSVSVPQSSSVQTSLVSSSIRDDIPYIKFGRIIADKKVFIDL